MHYLPLRSQESQPLTLHYCLHILGRAEKQRGTSYSHEYRVSTANTQALQAGRSTGNNPVELGTKSHPLEFSHSLGNGEGGNSFFKSSQKTQVQEPL